MSLNPQSMYPKLLKNKSFRNTEYVFFQIRTPALWITSSARYHCVKTSVLRLEGMDMTI